MSDREDEPPVQETETEPPVQDPQVQVRSFRPPTPKMGGLMQVSANEWCAWTGGKPNAFWTNLDSEALTEPNDDFQLRPSSPGSSQKSTQFREKGLETKFKKGDHLLDFINIVDQYFTRTGLDTITYLHDPDATSNMISVVNEYSKFNLQDAITASTHLRKSFDRYDRNNDDSARNWLLASVHETLRKDISERLSPFDGFASHWLQMIHLIESTSYKRFTNIKEEIERLSVHQFPGQSVKDLSGVFLGKAKELENHGFYEHRLTLVMLDSFLEGGGSGADIPTAQYRHVLFESRQKLDNALVKIGRMDSESQDKYMISKGLTYREICSKAEEEWKKLYDDGKWGPAKTKTDLKRPPTGFGANIAKTEEVPPASIESSVNALLQQLEVPPASIQASVNALLQQLQIMKPSTTGSGIRSNSCHTCGKPGHWSRDCPEKGTQQQPSNVGRPLSWKVIPPDTTQGCIKLEGEGDTAKWKVDRNGKAFYWCGKCNRWSTTHWTTEHTGRKASEITPSANLSSLSATGPDDVEDWPCAFMAQVPTDDWDEPSSLLGGMPPFALHIVIGEIILLSALIQYLGLGTSTWILCLTLLARKLIARVFTPANQLAFNHLVRTLPPWRPRPHVPPGLAGDQVPDPQVMRETAREYIHVDPAAQHRAENVVPVIARTVQEPVGL
jgi:hypothetical protein